MNIKELIDFIELLNKRDLSRDPLSAEEKAKNIQYLRTLEDLALRINGDWDKVNLRVNLRTMQEVM